MKKLFLYFIIIIFNLPAGGQNPDQVFTVVFYNVENLYDTLRSPGINDSDYTPAGSKKWNSERYFKKINDIARVLSTVNENILPEIIGLAGIENARVLQDLINSSPLRKGNYGYIHKDGPDPQGLELALLYRKDRFKPAGQESIPVLFPFDSTLAARDILYVSGKLPDDRQIHFYVNHWCSRSGDLRSTEPRRMYCAVALRRNIDLVLSRDSRSKIIIMGDFNDEPTNKSLMNVLQASNKRKNKSVGEFYNLMYDMHNLTDAGTSYQGSWLMTDQIIVSHNLLTAVDGFRSSFDSAKIFSSSWMLQANNQGISVPFRTYSGNEYLGGVSDHLPVYVVLTK